MIKKNYKKIVQEQYFSAWRKDFVDRYCDSHLGRYTHKYSHDRNIHTQNERRQNCWAQDDGYHIRGRRRYKHLRHNYDDPRISRVYGRSWKDFTKYDKQYKKNLK